MDLNLLSFKNRDDFIKDNLNFIKSVTYNICKRPLSQENDDELSIALIAFNKACDSYNNEKVHFHSYASTIIRNALIDFFRKNSRETTLIFSDEENHLDYIDYKISMEEYSNSFEKERRNDEIAMFVKELSKFGLTFNDLTKFSPSHNDTRNNLLNISLKIVQDTPMLTKIKEKKQLPIKEICLLTGSSKKIIEKWRRYIIALVLILCNEDFLYLRSYLNIKEVGEIYD